MNCIINTIKKVCCFYWINGLCVLTQVCHIQIWILDAKHIIIMVVVIIIVNFGCKWMLPVRDVEILPAWIGPRSGGYFGHWGKHTINIVVLVESLQSWHLWSTSVFLWHFLERLNICGSFQKFCTLYIFSLKMNLFYEIHLQAFIVISIVLYHSIPTFGKFLYSCQDVFAVDVSDYSGHLIRHLSMLLKHFSWSGFFNFGNKSRSGGLMSGLYGGWGSTCHPYFSKISNTAPEAWGRTLSCKMRTPAANMGDLFWQIFGRKMSCRNFL